MTREQANTPFMRTNPKDSFERFGKLGILLDEKDASYRLARQLYGTERLPYWWVLAETVEQAGTLLSQALQWVGDDDGLVVVLERYVPLVSGRLSEAWDVSTEPVAERLRGLVDQLHQNAPPESRRHLAFRTSFPHRPADAQPHQLPWRRQTPESGSTLRTQLLQKMKGFLAFGPDKRVDAGWAGLVEHCGSQLALPTRARSVVLLTGEEFVRPEHDHSPGIPAWKRLRDRALPRAPTTSYDKIDALRSMTAPDLRRVEAVQMEHEHSFPYKAWLAVRLPWTWIMSFGTDSCIQRAASAYSSYADATFFRRREHPWDNAKRDRALRFRRAFDLLDEDLNDRSLHWQNALFQPHQGLLSQIRYSNAEAQSLARAFDTLQPESGRVLVVMLGLSLHRSDRKDALEAALASLKARGLDVTEQVDITWVHSMPDEEKTVHGEDRRLLRGVLQKSRERQHGGGPDRPNAIPFDAGHGTLDFLYDVTLAYEAIPTFARTLYDAYAGHKEALLSRASDLGLPLDWDGAEDRTLATVAFDAHDRVSLSTAERWLGELASRSEHAATVRDALPEEFPDLEPAGDDDGNPEAALVQLLVDRFTATEIRSMGQPLGIEDDLLDAPASTKETAHSMAMVVLRRGDEAKLLDLIEQKRPRFKRAVAQLRRRFELRRE